MSLKYKGGTYYHWKDSPDLVKVSGRYYRKVSGLITRTIEGGYALKKDCVVLTDGTFARKEDKKNVVKDGDSFYNKAHFVTINNKRYRKTDPTIVYTNNDGYQLRSNCNMLSKVLYTSDTWVTKARCYDGDDIQSYQSARIVKTDDGWAQRSHTSPVIDFSSRKRDRIRIKAYTNRSLDALGIHSGGCFAGVRNSINDSDLRNYRTAMVLKKDEKKVITVQDGYLIPKFYEKNFNALWERYYEAYLKKEVEALRREMNRNFSDRDADENVATIVKKDVVKHPGGRIVRGMDFRSTPVFANDTALTGGLAYTYGIELEASAGEIPTNELKERNVALAGDGSVGANEYVSGILFGSAGMAEAGELMAAFRKSCYVNDQCGVHVHVGGYKNKNVTTPGFGRDFALNAIKLGTIIEPELYQISPENRRPSLRYCGGISEFKKISEKNWRSHLGKYVRGDSYTWQDGDESRELGRWAPGRYKWLNLVNCCSVGRQRTLEIRIWAGTTSFNKLRCYILLSLAIVNFIDNHSDKIWDQEIITLSDIVYAAFGKDSEITESLIHFIDKRKQSFNRTIESIYN